MLRVCRRKDLEADGVLAKGILVLAGVEHMAFRLEGGICLALRSTHFDEIIFAVRLGVCVHCVDCCQKPEVTVVAVEELFFRARS